ncbi:hypothetical protein FISHEDRAFT_69869 [Fistulina hepatica ATCC 64428]|uniref:C4-dicarboxylate transporter/malic acid transport protein n=1 Tax=Fistulina hepatica ATCC 64428 TaxID=1128425 RepID=A0A0D7AMB5_9AGAR|nr:hypothetical protein FISHEDRAFT_69869 [Fistulina hepatica ATCC 64428]
MSSSSSSSVTIVPPPALAKFMPFPSTEQLFGSYLVPNSNGSTAQSSARTSQITLSIAANDPPPPPRDYATPFHVSRIARRIHGWSWQGFPIGMGTGAVYVVLSNLESDSVILNRVELAFYFMNICMFLFNTITLSLQAIFFPKQALRLIKDPVKSIFVPLIVLSFATIIIGTKRFAPNDGISANFMYTLYWVYVVFGLMACWPIILIWFDKPHDLNKFTPAYAFLMLVGIVAYNVLDVMEASDPRTVGVLLVAYFFQGLGFFMTFLYICIYILRIVTTGFMEGDQASGAFIAVGPPGFTALALIKLGEHAQYILKEHNLVSSNAGEIWYACSVMSGLLLFGFAVFLFLLGILPYWHKLHKHLDEILSCWSLTFPNVGWISTVRVLADVFNVGWLGTIYLVLAICMCVIWLVLAVLTIAAAWKGIIFLSAEEDVARDQVRLPLLHAHHFLEKKHQSDDVPV